MYRWILRMIGYLMI